MWNLKTNDINELMDKTQRLRIWTCGYRWGRVGRWGGINWEFGIDRYTLLYLKEITDKDLTFFFLSISWEKKRETQELTLFSHARAQIDRGSLQARKSVLTRNQPCWHLAFGLPASRTETAKFCGVSQPFYGILWHIAVQTNTWLACFVDWPPIIWLTLFT